MASTVRYDWYKGYPHKGIELKNAVGIYVSGSQILRLPMLISIRILDSERITIRVGIEANQKTGTCPRRPRRLTPPSSPLHLMEYSRISQ